MPTYIGKVCATHPELGGKRRNGNCPACMAERPRRKTTLVERRRRIAANPDAHREKVKRWREKNREKFVAGKLARNAVRRARKKAATGEDSAEIRRAWIALSKRAKRLGKTIDHIVPIAGCRVCGEKGTHEPDNWQLLTPRENSSKGDRCHTCWVTTHTTEHVRNQNTVPDSDRERTQRAFVQQREGTDMRLFPDFGRRRSDDAPVATTEVIMAPPKKKSPSHAGPTAFSQYCKEHKIDGAKARRKLRLAGLRAPYNPEDKRVKDILKLM